jgi:dipeptidyl aminopeptidase/acylaminoacyl peptidase
VGLPTVPGNLAWSPDGQALAFSVTTGAWGDDLEQFVPDVFICEDLYVVRPGALPVRVVHLGQGHGATLPVWSADGTQLAYVTFISSERPNKERGVWPPAESRTIGIVDLGTGTSRTVATCRACHVAAWSPDGTTLVTVHDAGGGRGITFYDSTTGATLTTLLEEESFDSLLWGPDARSFHAIGYGPETWFSVYHVSLDPEPHADPPLEIVPWGISVSVWRNSTALSPDHATVAFLQPSPDGVAGTRLWIAPVGESAMAHPIGDMTEGGFPPMWSPDGAQLLLRTPVERSAPHLAVIDRDGTVLQRLATSRGLVQQSGQPAWQPVWP